ncbi:barstar family protein [Lactiplantibacillus plantarum]|uniref:barstar family protein n=2 Tax=Lactiplantibacillus plantarum TaxID=1590 RepID=UPI00078D1578|nr:barstar family protein [Lactiplantibacillus plantarum]ARW14149.1 hypothetical protein S100434_02022 [Lactiplantibacillus plantarum subsp. plantarum]MCG3569537.1 barstar family protein [Lactiplantibacillus plantarum]MCG3572463.1 barstar family protein [Lactiplantibacillus plantarum]MCK6240371.1 barstar family protein [Lactiplantibacillus plantarum]MDN7029024.1 barstar family protein [Lactiplantibacillus plantarum]
MENNVISYINSIDIKKLRNRMKTLNYYIVEVPGAKIQTKRSFLDFMGEKFSMPDYQGWDAYADWMKDLSWIPNRRICVIIDDYSSFLRKDSKARKDSIELFKDDILPFWEKDVLKFVVGGKTRVFKVYLVN